MMLEKKTPVAIVGLGKIARDQHLPAIAASDTFMLGGIVSLHTTQAEVPVFRTIRELAAALPEVRAVSICTPPLGRLDLIAEAFACGLDVLMEKPPAATVSEAEHMIALARRHDRVLYLSWHSREAVAVSQARAWLAAHPPRRIRIDWLEDVRVWHPGQEWIWQPGIGVFDPGINALSILTALVDAPMMIAATLDFPENREAPIAAALSMTSMGSASGTGTACAIEAAFSFDQHGPQTWTLHAETEDGRSLVLRDGGAALTIDGEEVTTDDDPEYRRLYRHFAALLAQRASDTDIAPLRLVADAFLIGQRRAVAPFEWS